MNLVFISLGANQQDPVRTIRLANKKIQALTKTSILHASNIFPTEPFGVTQQPLFFNQIIKIHTGLTPLHLLDGCQHIERQLGRVRHLPWGPRMIDIDILSYNHLHLSHPRLILPHPQIFTRAFIQEALQEHYPEHFPKIDL